MSEISGVTFDLLEKLRCFTDVDLTSTSIKHSVRNFEYRTDQKQSIGACMLGGYFLGYGDQLPPAPSKEIEMLKYQNIIGNCDVLR